MNIRELQEEAHAIAKDHGWRDEERTFGDLIALVHSELSEALEAYREYGNTINAWMELVDEDSDDRIPVGVGHELADVVIRVADMAEWYGVDNLATHVQNAVGGPGDQAFGVGLASRELTFGEWVGMAHYWTAEAFKLGAQWEDDGRGKHLVWMSVGEVVAVVQRMATHYGIDLDVAIEAKMEYNRGRSYRHGGKAL